MTSIRTPARDPKARRVTAPRFASRLEGRMAHEIADHKTYVACDAGVEFDHGIGRGPDEMMASDIGTAS